MAPADEAPSGQRVRVVFDRAFLGLFALLAFAGALVFRIDRLVA